MKRLLIRFGEGTHTIEFIFYPPGFVVFNTLIPYFICYIHMERK